MAGWARAASAACAQATRSLLRTGDVRLGNVARGQQRGFASGAGHDSVTYEGLSIHKPARWHVYTGQVFAGVMWFWIFYRFYNDHETFLYGHAAHFDHEEEHAHGGKEEAEEHHH